MPGAGLDISTPDVSQPAPSDMKYLIDMATSGEINAILPGPAGTA
jgi:hypothetical protein